jgi:CRISPR/Cas system-associated exonuclease Cas4 (RecB family)
MELTPAPSFEEIRAILAENSRQIIQSRQEYDELKKQLAKDLAESRRLLDHEMRQLAKKVGDITDTLGKFAQEQVRPRLVQLFREQGIIMDEIHPNVVVEKEGLDYLEIDLLLVNTIYSVVVEVKNTLRQKDVDEHILRLEKLQEFPTKVIKGTKMYGAVAGMIVNKEVERYAIKKGLYVVKPKGDSVEISNDASFKGKTWEVRS